MGQKSQIHDRRHRNRTVHAYIHI